MRTTAFRPLALGVVIALVAGGSAWAQTRDILSGKPLLGSPAAAPQVTPESIVTVESHFTIQPGSHAGVLTVTAKIAPGWHVYSTTQKPVLAEPTTIKIESSNDYRLLGDFRPNLPPRVEHKDDAVFEEYDREVTWQAPVEFNPHVDPRNIKITGAARIQTCREGACLQPHAFPIAATLAAETGAPVAVGEFNDNTIHATLRGFMEPQVVTPGSKVRLVIEAEPTAQWHAYELASRDTGSLGYKPTLIVLTNTSGLTYGPTSASSPAAEKPSAIPGGSPQRYHEQRVAWTTVIEIPKNARPGQYPIEGLIGYQTCSGAQCDQPHGARFSGMVVVGQDVVPGRADLAFQPARYIEAAKLAEARPVQTGPVAVAPATTASSLPMVILASLIGGFILNFMPCVLPVIGLKILSFADQAGRSRGQVLGLNLWYSAGLMAVFMVLATAASAVNLGLGSENLGWGEQFKYTSFNIAMVAIVWVMALSFLGVWEIPIPGFVGSGKATEMAAREGAAGAFAKGILTTILATPCSGPLLGFVFGFTLGQTAAVKFLVFGCIGLGMASPYLLIGAFPHLIRFLPKPGAWMDTFKQMMGFVMLGTIVFLFTFMDRNYLVPTFAMMIGLWAGCWWIGRTSLVEPLSVKLKAWGQGAAFAALIGWLSFSWLVPHSSIIPWKDFSQPELARLTSEGKTVLIDFTADWCWTCKMNLHFAIETDEVKGLIEQNQVVPLLADWTSGSPEIKKMLESLDSASIPVLAVFPGDGRPPIVRRDVVTKQQVVEALKEAGPSKETKPLTASMPPR